jgi:hypothetical protein
MSRVTSDSDRPTDTPADTVDAPHAGAPDASSAREIADAAHATPRAGETANDTPADSALTESMMVEPSEEERRALRENARRVLRESGAAEILQTLNKHALQGRGRFEEYDSGVILKWGTSFTTRHIWVHVSGEQLQFRLRPHLTCAAPIPACDGEYHTFTPATWRIPNAVLREVDRNYKHPVAEASSD